MNSHPETLAWVISAIVIRFLAFFLQMLYVDDTSNNHKYTEVKNKQDDLPFNKKDSEIKLDNGIAF